jgi:hypothetical protein
MTLLPKSDSTQLSAEIHKTLAVRLDWFTRPYDIVSHHALGSNSERVYLGDKAKRVCRYCGLATPQVKFKKLARAIPTKLVSGNTHVHGLRRRLSLLQSKGAAPGFS